MAGGENGPVIVPGAPDESTIVSVLEAGHFAKLSDEQMGWLIAWIAAGAPEAEGAAPAEAPAPTETTGADPSSGETATATPEE